MTQIFMSRENRGGSKVASIDLSYESALDGKFPLAKLNVHYHVRNKKMFSLSCSSGDDVHLKQQKESYRQDS